MPSDKQIESIARGDREAFRILHRELYRPLFYYAYTIAGDRFAAEDAVQEAFVKYWNASATFDSAMAVKVYLYYVVRNLMRNHVHNARSHRRIMERMEPVFVASDADDLAMVAAETCSFVRRAVESLPDQTRRIIELSMEEMTVGEIAERMDISPNTVKTLKKAGYRSLRAKLRDLHPLLQFLIAMQ